MHKDCKCVNHLEDSATVSSHGSQCTGRPLPGKPARAWIVLVTTERRGLERKDLKKRMRDRTRYIDSCATEGSRQMKDQSAEELAALVATLLDEVERLKQQGGGGGGNK